MSMSLTARFELSHPGFTLDVDLALPGSGVTALFGPSGSGKTSCLRCVAGLEPAARGRLVVAGETWQDSDRGLFLPPHRRALGYVFQDANLFEHLDVRRNLLFGWKRVAPAARRLALEQVVELLGIEGLLARMPARLSGGERQRVGIARALLTSPRLLLMDEPLAALDAERKAEILPYLERLTGELALPILYVSHAPDEVARLADHLVLLEQGWQVLALDAEPEALSALRERTPALLQGRLETRQARFETVTLPRCDLLNSSFALPFCEPAQFPALWNGITAAVRPGGLFCGQLFGERDSWASKGVTVVDAAALQQVLREWNVLLHREEEEDGHTAVGRPKHWHIHHLVLQRR